MTALAYSEQVVAPRPPEPGRHRAARAGTTRRRSRPGTWNVLAEELVPFPPAVPRPEVAHELAGTAVPARVVTAAAVRTGPAAVRRARSRVAAGATRPASRSRGLRRLLPGVATLAILGCAWMGAGALSSLHAPELRTPPGASRVTGGYEYTVRAGDSLWSIVSALEPGGDPRPLVAQLEEQLHGGQLVPGERIKLP